MSHKAIRKNAYHLHAIRKNNKKTQDIKKQIDREMLPVDGIHHDGRFDV